MSPGAGAPTQVTIVSGANRAERRTRLRDRIATKPAGQRWALIGTASLGLAGDLAGVDRVVAAGGCPCCSARLVFDVTLVRLLRDGPWDRLLLEVEGDDAGPRLAALLSAGPAGARLQVDEILAPDRR